MSSTRDVVRGISAALVAALAAGCAHSQPRPAATQPAPLADAALQQREWPRSVAYYQNGSVPGFAPHSMYNSAGQPAALGPIVEPFAFIGDTVALPFTLLTAPAGTSRTFAGDAAPNSGGTTGNLPPVLPSVSEQGATPGYPNAPAGSAPNAPTPPSTPSPAGGGGLDVNTGAPSSNTPGGAGNNSPSGGALPGPAGGGAGALPR